MRQALALILLLTLCAPALTLCAPAYAREGRIVQLRSTPATQAPTGQRMDVMAETHAVMDQTLPSLGAQTKLLGPVLNCGNDGTIDAAGTLVMDAGDAAGTIFSPVDLADSLDITRVVFGVIDFGAVYPATMAIDFWHRTGDSNWDFVVGIDVAVDTNPGIVGETYDVDVSSLGLRTNNELMVLLSDLNPGRDGLMLPAGDSSQSCFNGTDFCSVILPIASSDLFLYGIVDAEACPGAVNKLVVCIL